MHWGRLSLTHGKSCRRRGSQDREVRESVWRAGRECHALQKHPIVPSRASPPPRTRASPGGLMEFKPRRGSSTRHHAASCRHVIWLALQAPRTELKPEREGSSVRTITKPLKHPEMLLVAAFPLGCLLYLWVAFLFLTLCTYCKASPSEGHDGAPTSHAHCYDFQHLYDQDRALMGAGSTKLS